MVPAVRMAAGTTPYLTIDPPPTRGSAMPYADLPNATIYYELSGDPSGEPLVMIHGLGAQLIAWNAGLVALIEAAGFRVIRFDNRDVGLSSKFDGAADRGYQLSDMSDDVASLLDHLGLERAHVIGQSMGGMIAQQFAIDHPDRVSSLCVVYSVPGPGYFTDDEEVWSVRNEPMPEDREGRIAQFVRRERLSGLQGFDDEWIAEFAARVIDRDGDSSGADRQAAAMDGAPDRTGLLRRITVPTAVIHGRDDRLISFEGGIAVARAIPGAELHVFPDMGHETRPTYWPDFVRILERNVLRSRAGARNA